MDGVLSTALVRHWLALTEQGHDCSLVIDGRGHVVAVSPGLAETLGHEVEELLDRPALSLIHPDDRERTSADWDRRRALGTGPVGVETRWHHEQGGERWLSWYAMGEPASGHVWLVATDVTERKQQAQRDTEDLLRSVFHDMRAGLVAQRADGTIFLSNQAALDILGLTEDQITGRTSMDEQWYSIHEDGSPFPGQDHPAMVSLRTGESITGVIMGVHRPRTNDRVWILIDSVVQRGTNGEVLRVLCSFIDITERKQAEDAARASDAMFRAVFHNAGLGVLLRDVDTDAIEGNPTFGRMIGRSSQELRQVTFDDLVHPEDRESSAAAHADLLAGSTESYELERRFVRPEGERVWVHETVSLVRGPSGAPRYVVEMLNDITDRKRMEAQLMLTDRMASLGTMAAGVGHEINNPLTWVAGNVSLALELLQDLEQVREDGPLADVVGALEDASQGTTRVAAIVRDLQAFSRVDDSPGAAVDLEEVVRSAIRMLHGEIRHRAKLELDLGVVPRVLGDSARIGQVLTNLLINALQALPDRPLQDNVIRVRTEQQGNVVVVEVGDNGVGIPPALQSRVFDPFFTTKKVGTGTGLGLGICHGIVSRLGGRIDFHSELEQGTTFRVSLPVASTPDQPRPPVEKAAPMGTASRRILCVDDEPSVGRLIERLLRNRHEVIVETEGERAIERVREGECFDAVICDLMMPSMTGMEVFDCIRAIDPSLADRCGFITAGALTERARSFAETLAPARLVRKPFLPETLDALLDELVRA